MRKDIEKKIKEPARYKAREDGIRKERRRWKNLSIDELDELPEHESIGMPHKQGWDTRREKKENYNPIKRWLRKQSGRPWSKVYSELCENISDPQIRQYINEYLVERDVETAHNKWGELFYIDADGIFRYLPKAQRKKRKKHPPTMYVDEYNPLLRWYLIDDVWYEVTFKYLDESQFRNTQYGFKICEEYDFLLNCHPHEYYVRKTYGYLMTPINKRQLSSKEIKELGL